MTIVVNDANVLIDLVKLSLLPQFFSLNLWIFDQLVANGKITGITATQKLKELVEEINTRLGLQKVEVKSRISNWNK